MSSYDDDVKYNRVHDLVTWSEQSQLFTGFQPLIQLWIPMLDF